MKQILAGITLTSTIVCAAAMVELPSTASVWEFMILGAAAAVLATLTLNIIKD